MQQLDAVSLGSIYHSACWKYVRGSLQSREASRVPPEGSRFKCVTPNSLILKRFKPIEAIEPDPGSTVQIKTDTP
jgi:hypothetical protein